MAVAANKHSFETTCECQSALWSSPRLSVVPAFACLLLLSPAHTRPFLPTPGRCKTCPSLPAHVDLFAQTHSTSPSTVRRSTVVDVILCACRPTCLRFAALLRGLATSPLCTPCHICLLLLFLPLLFFFFFLLKSIGFKCVAFEPSPALYGYYLGI